MQVLASRSYLIQFIATIIKQYTAAYLLIQSQSTCESTFNGSMPFAKIIAISAIPPPQCSERNITALGAKTHAHWSDRFR